MLPSVKFVLLLAAENMAHFRSNIQSPASGQVNGHCDSESDCHKPLITP